MTTSEMSIAAGRRQWWDRSIQAGQFKIRQLFQAMAGLRPGAWLLLQWKQQLCFCFRRHGVAERLRADGIGRHAEDERAGRLRRQSFRAAEQGIELLIRLGGGAAERFTLSCPAPKRHYVVERESETAAEVADAAHGQ